MATKKVKFKVDKRKAYPDPKYSSKMKEFFSFSVPGARFMPVYKMGAWDGKISMMKDGYVNIGLLRGMKAELEKVGYYAKISKWRNRPKIKEFKKGIVSKDPKYAYQNDCVQSMRDNIEWGGGLILSATGTGKTAMAAMLASWLDCNILFVTDQRNLLYQAQKEIGEWLSKHEKRRVKVGIVGDGKYAPERVTSATIQTLDANKKNSKFRKWFKSVDIIIIDEIHTQMSRRQFAVMHTVQPKAVFGLTATLQLRKKPTRMKAYSMCGPVIYSYPVKEASEEGVLTKGIALQVRVPCDEILDKKRESWYYSNNISTLDKINLDYKINVVRNKIVNAAVLQLIVEGYKHGFFSATLLIRHRHISIIKKALRALKYEPQVMSGKIKQDSRERKKERFEKGEEKILLCSSVFTKGVNIKRLDLIIDAAQRANQDDTQQKFGRGVRLHKEKDGLIFLDIVSAYKHKPKPHRKGEKLPRIEAAAKKRFNALKKAGIPIKEITYTNAKDVLNTAEKFLKEKTK